MGICYDKSVNDLIKLGYNIVRHPTAELQPLTVVGIQDEEARILGLISSLIASPPSERPNIKCNVAAADIEGKKSSKLKIGIGTAVLNQILSAMGNKLALDMKQTNAKTLEFRYVDVKADFATPLDVGNYLKGGDIDGGNPLLTEYLLGAGRLFLIAKVVKCKRIIVRFETDANQSGTVDVTALGGLVSGKIKMERV